MQNTLVDTGFLIGLFNRNDKHHSAATSFLESKQSGQLLTTWPCVTESCFFLDEERKVGLLEFIALEHLVVMDIDATGLSDMQGAIAKYGERVDLADASLVWLANKTGVNDIFTIDRKDFDVYRLDDGKYFNVVP
jgi:predicted nucleic acid-binding protein